MQRVLEVGFEYYSGCEDDLINFLKESLDGAYQADKKSLSIEFGANAFQQSKFTFRCEAVTEKVITEIKIFTNRLSKEKKPWSLEKWCVVIGAIVGVIGLIWIIVWGIFIWYEPTPEKTQLVDSKYDTTLAKDYDSKFENMTKKRALAAIAIQEYLSKGKWSLVTNNTDALDDVLGFFETMGYDQERGLLSPDTTHEYFCDDIMAYYQASQDYITESQKKDGATAYEHIKPLFKLMVETEAKKEHTNAVAISWSKDDLWKYFQAETNSVNLK